MYLNWLFKWTFEDRKYMAVRFMMATVSLKLRTKLFAKLLLEFSTSTALHLDKKALALSTFFTSVSWPYLAESFQVFQRQINTNLQFYWFIT